MRAAARRRAVLLDYDGVVTSLEENGYESQSFGARAVRNLNELCRRWDAHIVLTSSWRAGSRPKGDAGPFHEAAARYLAARGVAAPLWPGPRCAVPEFWLAGEDGLRAARKVRAAHGVVLEPKAYNGHTLPDAPRRGDEVRAWQDVEMPDADDADWVLLDDEDDYWPSQMHRLVRTHEDRGFDDEALERALSLVGA